MDAYEGGKKGAIFQAKGGKAIGLLSSLCFSHSNPYTHNRTITPSILLIKEKMAIVDSNVNLGSVCYPKKDATASPPPGLTSVAPIARRSLTPDQDYYLGSHSVENPFIQHIGSFNSTDGSTEPAKWTEILSPQCIQSQPEPVNALALNTANADEALPEERRLSQSSSLVDMFEQSTLSPENDRE